MTFKDLRIGTQFYFQSETEWYSRGMSKGPFVKVSARKYQDARSQEHRIGSIHVWVIRTG